MGIEHLYDAYSPTGDMISFICCVTLLLIIKWVLFFSKDTKFFLLKMALHFILVGTFVNVLFYEQLDVIGRYPVIVFTLRTIYHTCFSSCIYLFALYLKSMMNLNGKLEISVSYFTRILFVVCLVMDALSPITKFGFYREGDLWYDPIISPYNIFYVLIMLIILAMMVKYAHRLVKSVHNCLVATTIILVIIMAYSAYANINTFTSFTYVLPIMVVMVLLHSKPFDDKTGSLSTDSFGSFVNESIKKGHSFDYLILKLNLHSLDQMSDELGKVLNSFWQESFKDALLFRIEHDEFVLAIPRNNRNGNTENKVRHLIQDDFPRFYSKYQLDYKIIFLNDIDFIRSDIDLKNMINYVLITMKDNTTVISDNKLKEQLRLMRSIKKVLEDIEIQGDLDDPRVLVYCQPIKNIKSGRFDTAEALMRLDTPENGIAAPYLFIPLAEYYGHIHALTRVMLNKVCKQIKQLESEGYKFDRISVNFAASEIKLDSFCDEILEIIRSNGIEPGKIGIELTESQNESDFNIVREKISVLKEAGMTLYLDDVGTGYSNLDRIVKYDVDVVKFDRFFLLESEKNPKVAKMMNHLSEAFKDLNYKLLYEGVETEENELLCLRCRADYIQGYKYSKPIPIEDIRNFFSKGVISYYSPES